MSIQVIYLESCYKILCEHDSSMLSVIDQQVEYVTVLIESFSFPPSQFTTFFC